MKVQVRDCPGNKVKMKVRDCPGDKVKVQVRDCPGYKVKGQFRSSPGHPTALGRFPRFLRACWCTAHQWIFLLCSRAPSTPSPGCSSGAGLAQHGGSWQQEEGSALVWVSGQSTHLREAQCSHQTGESWAGSQDLSFVAQILSSETVWKLFRGCSASAAPFQI